MVCVSVCMYIYVFKGIFCVTIFLIYSCRAGEQRKCLYTTVNAVQFRKNVWVFFKKKNEINLNSASKCVYESSAIKNK